MNSPTANALQRHTGVRRTIGDLARRKLGTLANGSTILQQVQAIQAMGGNITISFGGAAG